MWHCFSSGSSGSSGSYSTCRSTAASSMTVTQTPSGRSRSAIIAALPNWGASSRPRTPQSRRCWAGRGRTSWQQHLPALVLRWRPGRQLAAVAEDAQPLAQAAPVPVGVEQLRLQPFELLLHGVEAGGEIGHHLRIASLGSPGLIARIGLDRAIITEPRALADFLARPSAVAGGGALAFPRVHLDGPAVAEASGGCPVRLPLDFRVGAARR